MGKLEVDRALIRELASLLDETGLTEIEVSDKEHRLRVARQPAALAAALPAAGTVVAPAAPSAEPASPANHPGALKSPMVGTLYHAAEPGAAPFVAVGAQVRKGQIVAIIEAMKTFNEIPSPRDGVVRQILVENGAPVEYGDVLMLIE
jgi:acetyl-CoA carboxylase biotin carboxyl carrier protein